MGSQPLVGLLPEQRAGAGAGHRGYFAAGGSPLGDQAAGTQQGCLMAGPAEAIPGAECHRPLADASTSAGAGFFVRDRRAT